MFKFANRKTRNKVVNHPFEYSWLNEPIKIHVPETKSVTVNCQFEYSSFNEPTKIPETKSVTVYFNIHDML